MTEKRTTIDCNAVVRHIANTATSEFDKRRCEKEHEKFSKRIEEIRSEPFYKWPGKK